jgi:hypothetical protein
MRILAFVVIVWLISITPALALSNKVSTTFETGERSSTDTIDDRDLSGNLDFYRYHLRLDHEVSKSTKYNFSYEHYIKDYETVDNFDSTSDQWNFGLEHTFENFKLSPLKVSLDAGFKNKDYKNSPSSDYERSNATIGLGYKNEDLWALSWENGFINYDYVKSGEDQLKLFTQLSGWVKFINGRLKINPSYKFQNVDKEHGGNDRSENTVKLASSYKVALPYFSSLAGTYTIGKNDTKDSEDEDRDDDVSFKYAKWHVNTAHPLLDNIDTNFKYGRTQRAYYDSNNNYKNWFIENKTDIKLHDDKSKKINLSINSEHKEGDYDVVDTLRYTKNAAGAKLSYAVKNNWELSPSFTFKKYDYPASPAKNENQYVAKLEFEKKLLDQNLELKLTYSHSWKDYRYKSNITLWVLKAGVAYKF